MRMNRHVLAAVAVLFGCGGGGGGGGDDGTMVDAPTGLGSGWEVSYGPPAAIFELESNTVQRWVDLDGDGDVNEQGEATRFVMESGVFFKDIVAIDGHSLLMIRNSNTGSTGQIQLSSDANGDGDASDPGESHIVFAGRLPSGAMISRILGMTRSKDGRIFVSDSPGGAQQRIYQLTDQNMDGDTDDSGEVIELVVLPNLVQTDAMAVDGNGDLWFAAKVGMVTGFGADLYRVRSGTASLVVSRSNLMTSRDLLPIPNELAVFPDGSIGLCVHRNGKPADPAFVVLRDGDGDREITASEVAIIWDLQHGDFFIPFHDVVALDDGSVAALTVFDQRFIYRMVDGNDDGEFLDVGETYAAHDSVFAMANGQASLLNPTEIAAAILP